MKKIITIVVIIALVLIIPALWLAGSYNTFVRLDEQVKTSWANVETSYQRRADLIPNIVNTVQGAASFESATLQAVVEARAKATSITVDPTKLDAASIAKFQEAQGAISSSLGRLIAVAENYPQLQSVQAFRDLQVQLEGTENRIGVARMDYNNTVLKYNSAVRAFPGVLIANIFGFEQKAQFSAEQGADQAPTVDFTN